MKLSSTIIAGMVALAAGAGITAGMTGAPASAATRAGAADLITTGLVTVQPGVTMTLAAENGMTIEVECAVQLPASPGGYPTPPLVPQITERPTKSSSPSVRVLADDDSQGHVNAAAHPGGAVQFGSTTGYDRGNFDSYNGDGHTLEGSYLLIGETESLAQNAHSSCRAEASISFS